MRLIRSSPVPWRKVFPLPRTLQTFFRFCAISNLVKDISQQIPIFTLSEILGIPEEDRHKLATWMEFLELAQYLSAENLKQTTGNEEEMEVDPSS